MKIKVFEIFITCTLLASCSSTRIHRESPRPLLTDSDSQKIENSITNSVKVFFAFDSARLTTATKQILEKEAVKYKTEKHYIIVEGHCDRLGTEEYNYKLGLERSKSIVQFLVKKGVDKNCLKATSYGKKRPVSKNLAKNRRGVLVYQGGVCPENE